MSKANPSNDEYPPIRNAFRIDPGHFTEWLKQARSMLKLSGAIGEQDQELEGELEKIANLALANATLWTTDGGVIVHASEPEAFKHEVKRKLVGVATTVSEIVSRDSQHCIELLSESIGKEGTPSPEELRKTMDQCIKAMRKGIQAPLILMLVIDVLSGILQSNLPAGLMSNAMMARLGYVRD